MIRTYYDEMYDGAGQVRPHYREFARWLADTPAELLAQRRREADLLFHRAGITFTLYGDEQGTERHRFRPRRVSAGTRGEIKAGLRRDHRQNRLRAGEQPADAVGGHIVAVECERRAVAPPARQRLVECGVVAGGGIGEPRAAGAAVEIFVGAADGEIGVAGVEVDGHRAGAVAQVPHRQRAGGVRLRG